MLSKKWVILSISVFAVFFCSSYVQAASINIFNTGVDGSNVVISSKAIDPHYTITSSPSPTYGPEAYAATDGVYPFGSYWFPNTLVSKWITPDVDTGKYLDIGNYTYSTTFDLTGLDPNTARISGNWSTDNLGVDILINGASTGNIINNAYSFQSFHAFAITSGFVSGMNTLEFVILNQGGPTGLRVEIAGTADSGGTPVPEPSTMMLLGSGLVGLVGYCRRRFKK